MDDERDISNVCWNLAVGAISLQCKLTLKVGNKLVLSLGRGPRIAFDLPVAPTTAPVRIPN